LSTRFNVFPTFPTPAGVRFEPYDIAYVGDRTKDVVGADIAGVVSVRVLQSRANERPREPRLAVERPDYVIENVRALLQVVSSR
jgi:phosphoglycolate phosphatase-like HAD superfamily hydrolase